MTKIIMHFRIDCTDFVNQEEFTNRTLMGLKLREMRQKIFNELKEIEYPEEIDVWVDLK